MEDDEPAAFTTKAFLTKELLGRILGEKSLLYFLHFLLRLHLSLNGFRHLRSDLSDKDPDRNLEQRAYIVSQSYTELPIQKVPRN